MEDYNYNYINLIIAMIKNRSDWSEGYRYVRDALKDFKIEDAVDQKVYDELIEIVSNDECPDGRVFRDCHHNYNELYECNLNAEEKSIVDKEMRKWYDTL